MPRDLDRRDFLKTAAAAGALASVSAIDAHSQAAPAAGRIGSAGYTPAEDYPIRPKRFSEVRISDTFWQPKLQTNAAVTIPFEVRKVADGGRGFNGNLLEAAILSLQTHPDPWLQEQVDARVRSLVAQPPRGNSGFEVAVAYYQATGKRDLLDPAVKSAAALYDDFVATNPPFSGGERDALNCLQLYRVTRDRKHLDLAKHYLDIRGLPSSVNRSRHNQSYMPVLDQREAVGHAVNGVTLMVSLADAGILTGLTPYLNAAMRLWRDAVTTKLYITGGVGSTGNEGFGEAYSLPTISAYAETCAVLMLITLSHRLFLATGDSQYIDVMERGMYNNALSGVASSGDRFFYVNRLASAGDGRDARWQRASLECCPPNLVRFLAAMPGYVYAQDARGPIYVNLYVSSEASFTVGGKALTLSVASEMPWGPMTRISVSAKDPVKTNIRLRIPGWARNRPVPGSLYSYTDTSGARPKVSVNGAAVNAIPDRTGYVSLDRPWTNGDVVEIDLPMPVRRVVADRRVRDARGRVAIERGPLVYCAEWPDIEGGRALDLMIDAASEMSTAAAAQPLDGVTVVRTSARSIASPVSPPKPVALVPYHLWANRGVGEMTVWISTAGYSIGDPGPAGGLIFFENPNYAKDGWRYLEAAPVDQSAGAKWGCFRRAIPGARGTAVGSGRQNTADMLTACTDRGTAADLCAAYSLNGVSGWFLPSRDELTLLYRNLRATGLGDFRDAGFTDNCSYWASSQQTADMAIHIDFADSGREHYDDKDYPRRVRAIRAF